MKLCAIVSVACTVAAAQGRESIYELEINAKRAFDNPAYSLIDRAMKGICHKDSDCPPSQVCVGLQNRCGVRFGPCKSILSCNTELGQFCFKKTCYAIVGTKESGESCNAKDECGYGLVCDPPSLTCKSIDKCAKDDDCAYGIPCLDKVCRKPREGEPCSKTEDCEAECAEGLCTTKFHCSANKCTLNAAPVECTGSISGRKGPGGYCTDSTAVYSPNQDTWIKFHHCISVNSGASAKLFTYIDDVQYWNIVWKRPSNYSWSVNARVSAIAVASSHGEASGTNVKNEIGNVGDLSKPGCYQWYIGLDIVMNEASQAVTYDALFTFDLSSK